MRQIHTLSLSLGALVLAANLAAQPVDSEANLIDSAAGARSVELAKLELRRMTSLVAVGALPRVRVEQAEENLADAEDQAVLDRTLYGNLPAQGEGEEACKEMLAAAERRVERQQARLAHAREIVSAGVAAQSYLLPVEQELTTRQTGLELAQLRARLMAQAAALNNPPAPVNIADSAIDDSEFFAQGMEHYEGGGAFDESRDLGPLELAFESRFARVLPISAEGETEVHRALGFDHRGRVDVAVDPNQPEGVWLRQYLKLRQIPYYAFTRAIPGKATAAHVHIGPGSTRLSSRVSARPVPRPHSAD